MRSKITSRILASLLSAALVIPMAQTAGFAVFAEGSSSAWSVTESSIGAALPDYVQRAFEKAMEGYYGNPLIPLACYGKQLVAGYNYYIICKEFDDNTAALKKVVVYDGFGDDVQLASVQDFNIDDYAHNYTWSLSQYPEPGSTEVEDSQTRCQLPSDAAAVFDKLFGGLCGVSLEPLAYLGKKTDSSGTDHAILLRRSAVVPDPDLFVEVMILHEDPNGDAYEKSSCDILGTRRHFETPDSNISVSFANSKSGYAEGTITLKADKKATYYLYWADNDGVLSGYYPIGKLSLSANAEGQVKLGNHTVIPVGVNKIVAVTNPDNLDDYYAVYNIPAYKQLLNGSGKYLYSFNAFSDIHIDKGNLWYVNAETNFSQGLKFAYEHGSDYVIVTGDCVTNDSGPDKEWTAYQKVLSKSDFYNPIWESDGNHDLRQGVSSGLKSFIKGTGTDGSKSEKSYFYTIEEKTGDMFIFMSVELDKAPHEKEIFSDEQLAWVTNLIENNYDSRNIFLLEHAPIEGFGAGDRMSNPYYGGLMNKDFAATKKFKALLQKYPNIVFLSGHTHEDFTMDYNYSNENGTAANMIHIPALAGSTMPSSDDKKLERNGGKGFNSQGYYVNVYENEIVFYGINVTEGKTYPAYSYIMEGSRTLSTPVIDPQPGPVYSNKTVSITDELSKVKYVLSKYYNYSSYDAYQYLKKYYYQFKDRTEADESILDEFESRIEALSNYTGAITYHALDDTYYFVNNKDWSNVYAYAWTGSNKNAAWPGVKINKVGVDENNKGVYSIKFESVGEFENLIFNSGSSSAQTVDISLQSFNDNAFKISGSENGKYTVSNFHLDNFEDTRYTLLYYVTDEHDWTQMDNIFKREEDGTYTTLYEPSNDKTFSFSIYDKVSGKYYTLSESVKLDYAADMTYDVSLSEMSSRGKSVSVYGLDEKKFLNISFDPETKKVSIFCAQTMPEEMLSNDSTVSIENSNTESTVTINAVAAGGAAPYRYSYFYKLSEAEKWTQIGADLGTENKAVVVIKEPASYDFMTVIMDSTGETAQKTVTAKVFRPQTLNNTSVINSNTVQIGDKVRVSASANGGTAPYTYAYYYKRSTNTSWKTLGTEFGTTSSVSFAPTAEADYDVKVIVRDSTGATAEKLFTVTALKDLELTNVSVLQRTNIKVGSAIPMIGKAVGGTAPYTYRFQFKRSTNTNWKTLGDSFGTLNTARLKPTASGSYDIKITVKDSTGTTSVKQFTATVK